MQVNIVSGGSEAASTGTLVVPIFEEGTASEPALEALDAQTGGALSQSLESGRLSHKPNKVGAVVFAQDGATRHVLAIGVGSREDWNTTRARKYCGTAVRQSRGLGITLVTVVVPEACEAASTVAAMIHGAYVANFSTGTYKTRDKPDPDVETLGLLVSGDEPGSLERAVEHATVIGEATNLARSLANEPGNRLTPNEFADRAEQVALAGGLDYHAMDENELEERGYGALLGVSQGSRQPARMVTLRYLAGPDAPTIGFVGKGVTFDSGGISIKPADRMHLMKGDMSGAAAVLGAMQAVAHLKPKVNVVGVLCLSENLPDGAAMKPGDILVAGNGMTIEILNTDAEGRLVLADGLVHARSQGATHLVDVATLTGACVVALGTINTGVFASSTPWADMLLRAAEHTGETMWRMPISPEYREQMDSNIADIANAGGREGGAISAATFLQEFTGDVPWVHLDIAGTARTSKSLPYMEQGPTGVAVATLTRLAESVGEDGAP